MGTEIYGSRFRNGISVGIDVHILEEAFTGLVAQFEPAALMLDLRNSGDVLTPVLYQAENGIAESFAVIRPVDDPRLYAALFQLCLVEGLVLYVPGSQLAFGHPDSASHLPPEMVEALGAGGPVRSPGELYNALFSE